MSPRTELSPPLPDPPRKGDAITRGLLRGVLGSLMGCTATVLALVALTAFGRRVAPPASMAVAGLAVLLPGACPGIAISWQCRCSPWRRALAVVGPALSFGFALGALFLVLIGFQAHADLVGYFLVSGIVFALAGAIAAGCLAPALRLGSVRAGAELVVRGAVAFLIGGLAHGAIVSLSMSRVMTRLGSGTILAVPAGFALALMYGWGNLGGGAQQIQARARRDQEADRGADVSS